MSIVSKRPLKSQGEKWKSAWSAECLVLSAGRVGRGVLDAPHNFRPYSSSAFPSRPFRPLSPSCRVDALRPCVVCVSACHCAADFGVGFARTSHAGDLCVLRTCGDRQVSRSAQSCPTRLAWEASHAGPSARPRTRLRMAPLVEFVASGRLRPRARSPGGKLPSPASANFRAGLCRHEAGSSPCAAFAARATNRLLPVSLRSA